MAQQDFGDVWSRMLASPPKPEEPKFTGARSVISESPPPLLRALLGSDRLLFCRQPQVVLALRPSNPRYEYLELLKVVLREACRVTWSASMPSLLVAKRLTEYQLAVMKPSGSIVVVDVDEVSRGESGEAVAAVARLSSTLEDRLSEVSVQVNQPGFIAIYGSHNLIHRLQSIWTPRVSRYGQVFYKMMPPVEVSIVEDDAVFDAVTAMYAVEKSVVEEAASLNDAVVAAEAHYTSMLSDYASDPTLSRMARPPVDEEESKPDQAFVHYALKMMTIANLLEAGYTESEIDTEIVLGNMPVDILVGGRWSQGIIVEVETLYGSFNPATRLSHVIRQRLGSGYSLWIVIPPLQAALYAKYIEPLVSRYKTSVEFYTIDFSTATLKPLAEHLEEVSKVSERLAANRLTQQS